MGLKLKAGLNPEVLRKYGFHLGKEDFGKERWCGDGSGYQYQAEWYHKFLTMDDDDRLCGDGVGKIAYTDDEYDIPMVQLTFKIGNGDDLWIDCAQSCTYHIEGDELDIIADTIFYLVSDGIVEKV